MPRRRHGNSTSHRVGPLQFHNYFTEDTHNSFLTHHVGGLSRVFYPALVALTLVFGFDGVRAHALAQTAIAVFALFGVATESFVIAATTGARFLLRRDVGLDRGRSVQSARKWAHRPFAVPPCRPLRVGHAGFRGPGCFGEARGIDPPGQRSATSGAESGVVGAVVQAPRQRALATSCSMWIELHDVLFRSARWARRPTAAFDMAGERLIFCWRAERALVRRPAF